MISIQKQDFTVGNEYEQLRQESHGSGAIVTFTGLVRDFNHNGSVAMIRLEHYAGMTEKSLMAICSDARHRWELGQIRLIHRIGVLEANEQIVFVGVSAKHRKNAFEAAEFIMDHLKTNAPLWKQEGTPDGMKWVDAKQSDKEAISRWSSSTGNQSNN
jgi:molybdopterin synthase catalytic subunit